MKIWRQGTAQLVLFMSFASIGWTQTEDLKKVSIEEGVSLHYFERGKGDPIIFVHGLTGDLTVWRRQLDGFASNGYRAISYSRRYNYPNRNNLLASEKHSAVREADDLAALIRKLNLKQIRLKN